MERFCKYCGEPLEKGQCVNPDCEEELQFSSAGGRKKPMTLMERRRQIIEAETENLFREEEDPEETLEERVGDSETEASPPETSAEERPPMPPRREQEKNPAPERERDTGAGTRQHPGSNRRSPGREGNCPAEGRSRSAEPKREKRNQKEAPSYNPLVRFSFLVSDYYRDPGRTITEGAENRDLGVGLVAVFGTLSLSALGTLIFGAMYLEDFFLRWVAAGIVGPVLAYGISFLFGRVFVELSPVGKIRRSGKLKGPICSRELFAVVTTASVFPNHILLLSGVLSPMDKDLRLFQFFALLLTVAWIVSLLFSLFTVYGGGFSFGGLLLTVTFAFLVFVSMRTLWVWYLTGEFRFTFHIPLNIFMN